MNKGVVAASGYTKEPAHDSDGILHIRGLLSLFTFIGPVQLHQGVFCLLSGFTGPVHQSVFFYRPESLTLPNHKRVQKSIASILEDYGFFAQNYSSLFWDSFFSLLPNDFNIAMCCRPVFR